MQRFWFGVSENETTDKGDKEKMPITFDNYRGLMAVMEYVYYQYSGEYTQLQLGQSDEKERALINKYARAVARKKANQ